VAITKGISTQVKKRKQMSKQTAVRWLEQEFIALQNYNVNEFGLFAKAKEMEKEQIKDAYWSSYKEGQYSGDKTADEYYNEKFKD
jgi:hypothetical protein